MCDASSDPTTYHAPMPQSPRTYRLSGSKPTPARYGSVALATIGEMLEEADHLPDTPEAWDRIELLKEVRSRVAEAEASL